MTGWVTWFIATVIAVAIVSATVIVVAVVATWTVDEDDE